jgi:hypothetical protein
VLGSRTGYVKYGLDPQEAALREGERPATGAEWGVERESMWGRIGSGESPLTGGGGDRWRRCQATAARSPRPPGTPILEMA